MQKETLEYILKISILKLELDNYTARFAVEVILVLYSIYTHLYMIYSYDMIYFFYHIIAMIYSYV